MHASGETALTLCGAERCCVDAVHHSQVAVTCFGDAEHVPRVRGTRSEGSGTRSQVSRNALPGLRNTFQGTRNTLPGVAICPPRIAELVPRAAEHVPSLPEHCEDVSEHCDDVPEHVPRVLVQLNFGRERRSCMFGAGSRIPLHEAVGRRSHRRRWRHPGAVFPQRNGQSYSQREGTAPARTVRWRPCVRVTGIRYTRLPGAVGNHPKTRRIRCRDSSRTYWRDRR